MDELSHGELGLRVDPGGPYCHVTQIIDNLPVLLNRLWVNLQLGDLLVSESQGGALPLALGLEFVDLQPRILVRDQAAGDGADNPLDGGIQFLNAFPGGRPVLSCAMGQALKLG